MTTQSNIDYRIVDATKYAGAKGHGMKQISKIGQKANQFRFISAEDIFNIQITFKTPAIITSIQMKVKETDMISVDMYNGGVKILTETQSVPKESIKVYKVYKFALNEKSQKFDRAQIRFCNLERPKSTWIHYILFKGFKEQTSNKKLSAPKNVSDKDVFEPTPKRKVTDQERKIFDTRNKQKGVTKTRPQDLVNQVVSDRHIKKSQKDQDAELQRVLELSKKQHEQKQGRSGMKKVEQDEFEKFDDIRQIQEYQFFDYEVVQWQKVKKVYEHVTPEWIQAQKKAQKQLNIQTRHSLSNKIKVKIFKDVQFCISNILGVDKSKLIQKIKELGGKIIDDPTNGCFLITNKMEGAKINLAKHLSLVKFIKPQYIDECYKTQAKLDYKQYLP